jgi:hypothetical protein
MSWFDEPIKGLESIKDSIGGWVGDCVLDCPFCGGFMQVSIMSDRKDDAFSICPMERCNIEFEYKMDNDQWYVSYIDFYYNNTDSITIEFGDLHQVIDVKHYHRGYNAEDMTVEMMTPMECYEFVRKLKMLQ